MATVLVTGGAGYIGSHACKALAGAGHLPVVYDNLENGHEWAVQWGPFENGDIRERASLDAAIARHRPDAVMHFAGYIEVGESVRQPLRFYRNNVAGSLILLEAMHAASITKIVFSSSCAVYGAPDVVPIGEDTAFAPISPYARSKLAVEYMLEDCRTAHGLSYAALRYFNAAGAIDLRGEDHSPESHLIPLALQVALGQRDGLTVFGRDYDTPDGSCIRDYVHVQDLARAHLAALGHLAGGGDSQYVNLGTGRGWSVLEVIAAARLVTGCQIPAADGDRRAGDASSLVADASKARAVLGWSAQIPDLAEIVASAWTWHSAHPSGYEGI